MIQNSDGMHGKMPLKSYNENLLPWQIVVTVDGDGWATLAEKAREKEWAHIESVIGEDLMNIIKENVPDLPLG